jgi:hypothetical protein
MAKNRTVANANQESSGSGKRARKAFALFRDHAFSLFQTVAAIGALAQLGINRFSTAAMLPGSPAQIIFTDGVADTRIHAGANLLAVDSTANANGLH